MPTVLWRASQALYAAGDVASATFEQVQTQAKSAQIQYDQAKLNYEYQMEFSHVTASIAGKHGSPLTWRFMIMFLPRC